MKPAMFHHFTNESHPRGQGALSADEFATILEQIGVENILPAQQWLERFISGTLHEQHTCITLDDNLRCQYDIALPVLDAYGLTAIWFVYSSPLEGTIERIELYRYFRTVAFPTVEAFYEAFFEAAIESEWGTGVAAELERFDPASWHPELTFYTDGDRRFRHLRDSVLANGPFISIMDDMLASSSSLARSEQIHRLLWMDGDCWRELSRRGHILGLHSHTHPTSLASMSTEDQHAEYSTNAQWLTRETGLRPRTVAHPSGSYSQATLAILRDLGIDIGFAVSAGVHWDPRMEIQRTDSAVLAATAGIR